MEPSLAQTIKEDPWNVYETIFTLVLSSGEVLDVLDKGVKCNLQRAGFRVILSF